MTTTTGDTMSRFIVLSFLLTSGDAANGTPMTAAQINVANRTNFCPVLSQIQAGTVPIAKALAGSTIQAAIHYGTPSFAMTIDNTTGLPTGGFYYLLQQELARRGGFTFTYNNVPNCMVSLGTQKCLQYNLPHFDIYANNWYSDTSARRFVGIGYTQQLVDASVVFVTQSLTPPAVPKTASQKLWNIFAPYTGTVWLVIAMVVIFNTIFNFLLEEFSDDDWMRKPEDKESMSLQTFTWSFFDSVLTMLGKNNISPNSWLASCLLCGYSFFVLLATAGYTANLVSFLLDANAPDVYIASIDDANSKSVAVCGMAGQTSFLALAAYSKIRPVSINTNQPPVLLQAMYSGQCVGVVLGRSDWDLYSQYGPTVNPNCAAVMQGDPLSGISGAWPYFIDFSSKCTSVVEIVLANIIVDMKADGTLASIYNAAIAAASVSPCAIGLTPADTAVNPGQLPVVSLSGAFVIYAGFCVLGLVVFIAKVVVIRRFPVFHPCVKWIEGKTSNTRSTKDATVAVAVAAAADGKGKGGAGAADPAQAAADDDEGKR